MKEKFIWHYCEFCKHNTKHDISFERKLDGEYGEYKILKQIVECRGCEHISFRTEEHDYWDIYKDHEENETYRITIESFPNVLKGHIEIRNLHELPNSIKSVYNQTMLAFKGKSYLLAGVGFRAIIEAICIQEKIKGNNLEIKINNLAKNRFITEREAERLHSIRFLGNDSVHEMEIPKHHKLILVLDIIENLFKNLYIIDKEAKYILDTIITEYSDFENLLWSCAEKQNQTDEKSLKELLGKHIRRIKIDIANIEKIVITRIENGEIEFLKLGKSSNINGQKTQLYIFTGLINLPF